VETYRVERRKDGTYKKVEIPKNDENTSSSKSRDILDDYKEIRWSNDMPLYEDFIAYGGWNHTCSDHKLTEQTETEQKEPEQPEETASDDDSRLGELASKPSTNVNNMKIQCTGVRESAGYIDGIEVDFKFTNNSDFEQSVVLQSLEVNNKEVGGYLHTIILGDRAETDRLTIKDSDLKRAGIDKIYNISVVFRVYNHDDWDDVTTNEMIMNFN